ncbi:undecaprenyl/decaprenyl-phosphate alpha-N-acetylglucosaminyl 1-phosphate transferase [Clostridiales bacterium F-3ap]|uniref:Undecaprenyl/decaprenyl-phosphate alpha-N-acetylglucosaminyl 1-phosphate transferase n=1 Tax=Anaerotalea alkaliphila TaxID=2662126 RepID=A0A7X5KNF5_9FIRM|nr:undecaprenyl/decaprenyl-phosphate alpha-N-acetylglucosaminyl 1-phosphate transferase [Anaerotalea alkaliphila]
MQAPWVYIGAFLMAFSITALMTPVSKLIAYKVGAIDEPKARGMHSKTMPLGGGTAIYFGFIVTVLVLLPFIGNYDLKQLVGLIAGATIITTVGLLDDIYDLSPRIRVFFQVLAALIVIFTGTAFDLVSVPFVPGGIVHLGNIGKFITVIWIIGVTNAVNLIDGLDGLAAGVASIASLSLMVISILFGEPAVAGIGILLTATLAGSCIGFLPHNFNPATIFMGDTGSTFLGFTLAVISIQGLLKTYTAITVVIAAVVLGLPIFDTFFAIARRVANKRPISQGDRGHLHHRLVDKGMSHRRAVLTLYGVSAGFGIAGILVAMGDLLFAVLVVILMLAIWFLDLLVSRMRRK